MWKKSSSIPLFGLLKFVIRRGKINRLSQLMER